VRSLRCWTCVTTLLLVALPAGATIHYTVSLAQPEEHVFHVTMRVPEVRDSLVVQMPAWNATYQIRDFAHRVRDVRARVGGHALGLAKLDKQTWQIAGNSSAAPLGTVVIEYGVYWDEPGPFSAELDGTHAFINFATILFYVPERRGEDVRVDFTDVPEGWGVAAALQPADTSTSLRAESYDALVDAPVEIGRYEEWRFHAGDARIRVIVHPEASGEYDRDWLTDAIRRIVAYQTQLMQEVPFQEYTFFYHLGVGSGGGMEHANSTAIGGQANAALISVTAHEFFHLWNVKRIRPATLEPVDYTRENWTRALWFAEGVTSTYTSFTLVRSGLWSREEFYDDLAAQITELESRPARLWQSVEQSSLDAWLEKYARYRGPESSISYYNKGQILGVLLDILIRDASDDRRSLDDVLRYLNVNFAHPKRTYNDSADIRAAAEVVAGRKFGEFFARYVAGTDELPCRQVLALAGLELYAQEEVRADLGFSVSRGPGTETAVAEVRPGTAAARAGIRRGDTLRLLDGEPPPRGLNRWLRGRQPGEKVQVVVARGDTQQEFTLVLAARGEQRYTIREIQDASDRQRRIREGLLRGSPSLTAGGTTE